MKSGYYIDLYGKDPKTNARLKDILSRSFLGYWRKKRAFDIVVSFLLIILTSPAMLLTALIIKLDDINSPVIYEQIRIGRHGKPFHGYTPSGFVINSKTGSLDMGICQRLTGPLRNHCFITADPVFHIKAPDTVKGSGSS